MRFVESQASLMGIAADLLLFFWQERVLANADFTLLLFGGLIIFAQSSAVATFIYTVLLGRRRATWYRIIGSLAIDPEMK